MLGKQRGVYTPLGLERLGEMGWGVWGKRSCVGIEALGAWGREFGVFGP